MDFFTLTFRQLERLVRRGVLYPGCPWILETGEKFPVKRVSRLTLAVVSSHRLRQVAEEAWVLTEELSPKMNLEVASGLFELYLTLADTQRFWSSIPGRWVTPTWDHSPLASEPGDLWVKGWASCWALSKCSLQGKPLPSPGRHPHPLPASCEGLAAGAAGPGQVAPSGSGGGRHGECVLSVCSWCWLILYPCNISHPPAFVAGACRCGFQTQQLCSHRQPLP